MDRQKSIHGETTGYAKVVMKGGFVVFFISMRGGNRLEGGLEGISTEPAESISFCYRHNHVEPSLFIPPSAARPATVPDVHPAPAPHEVKSPRRQRLHKLLAPAASQLSLRPPSSDPPQATVMQDPLWARSRASFSGCTRVPTLPVVPVEGRAKPVALR
jgi:hypothetical protein